MAEDAIVAQYIVKTDAAIAQLNALNARISAIESNSRKSGKGVEDAFTKMINGLNNQFKQLGASIAAAFAVDRVIQFGKEAVQLSAKAEGVERAFARIGSPELLDGLRRATKGTVSDLNLMTAAVRASNFKIPLEQMGTLLEFARRRAAETGESVDFLVDSIITGIGRKSPLILDNLGISAVALREKFGGLSAEAASVGDVARVVGEIAEEELSKMGDEAITAQTKIDRLNVAWHNFMKGAGEVLVDIFLSYESVEDVADRLENKYKNTSITEALKQQAIEQEKLNKLIEQMNRMAGKEIPAALMSEIETQSRVVDGYNIIIKKRDEAIRDQKNIQFDELTPDQANALAEAYKKQNAQRAEQIRNVFFLTNEIKRLKEEQEAEGTSRERVMEITRLLIPLQEELDALLGKQRDSVNNAAKALKELKERLGEIVAVMPNGIEGLRQFAVDSEGINNTLNTLNESLSQARAQLEAAPIGSTMFKQAQQDVEDLEKAIKRALGQDTLTSPYEGISSGILDEAQKAQKELEQQAQDFQSFLGTLQSGFVESASLAIQINSQKQREAIEFEMQLIEEKYKKGELTEKQYQLKQTQLRRKAAQEQKDTATFNATLAMSAAILNALQTQPFPVGLAMSAFATVLGLAQIAAIQSTPLPTYAEGGFVTPDGWIKGRSHKHGGVKLEAEGGEFIVNKKSAHKYSDLLKAINEDRPTLAPPKGWENLAQSIAIQQAFNDQNLLRAIDRHRESNMKSFDRLSTTLTQALNKNDIRARWN